jgi:trk system potassium uptake protein TrkH
VLGTTWLLLLDPKLTVGPTLFEVVSAFSTTGLSLGATTQLGAGGRLVLIALMFWGRLGAVTIMLVLLRTEPRKTLVKYPEEAVLVG